MYLAIFLFLVAGCLATVATVLYTALVLGAAIVALNDWRKCRAERVEVAPAKSVRVGVEQRYQSYVESNRDRRVDEQRWS